MKFFFLRKDEDNFQILSSSSQITKIFFYSCLLENEKLRWHGKRCQLVIKYALTFRFLSSRKFTFFYALLKRKESLHYSHRVSLILIYPLSILRLSFGTESLRKFWGSAFCLVGKLLSSFEIDFYKCKRIRSQDVPIRLICWSRYF